MSQDRGPSVLEYARFYGLTHDHLGPCPLGGFHGPDDLHLQLEDPAGVFRVDTTTSTPPSERLSASKEVVILLSSAIASPQGIHPFDESKLLEIPRRRNLKVELPILRSIHELDVLEFHRRIVPNLRSEHLPLEKIDEENDEGITWPSFYYRLPQTYNTLAMSERFKALEQTIRYLESVIKPRSRASDVPDLHDELELHNSVFGKAANSDRRPTVLQRAVVEPVTPPLLPLSPPATLFVPSSDVGHFALLSDHTTPTKQLAHDLELSITATNAVIPDTVVESDYREGLDPAPGGLDDLGQLYSTSNGVQEPPSSPPVRRAKPSDLKVEGPLTPPLSEQLRLRKTEGVSFREVLMDIIPDKPPPIEKTEDVSSEDTDAILAENIAPIAAKVDRGLEQEQLQEADTTRRVTVPIMDFSLPVPPWRAHPGNVDGNVQKMQKQLLTKTKTDHFKSHLWPANGTMEREMRWVPFPKELERVATKEAIPCDGILTDFLAQPECVDTSTLVWKPDGLRVVDEIYESDGGRA